jgi:radical SAM superfamily enzyme YgiQ (UPF0313 family)
MEPLAIAALSALTPPSVARVFHDDRLEPIPYDDPTDMAAITVETYTASRAYQIAAEYRRRGVPVVMGGFHATLAPDDVARHADAIVLGEAEPVWARVLEDLARGALAKRYVADKPAGIVARPDRTLFAGRKYLDIALVETGRGCHFACDFCSIASFFKSSYRARPIEEIVGDIVGVRSKNIFFVDDNIAVDRGRTLALLKALIPLKIRWVGQASLNVAADDEMLRLMQKSGCWGLLVGFESLNPAVLAAMGKQVNRNAPDYATAIARLRRHGISVYGTFVFGYDMDTPAAFQPVLDLVLRERLFFAAFNHLIPFPGTPLYDRLQAENRLLHEAWWLAPDFQFGDVPFSPIHFRPEELAARCLAFRKKFYEAGSILRRGLDLQANCRSMAKAFTYLALNLASRRDVDARQGMPLGTPEA